jgi:murein tripeptide amidase MpaA
VSETRYRKSKYYDYGELTTLLKEWGNKYPQLITLDAIGKSLEGRDIWYVEVSNKDTGKGEDKPAFYIDANLHAGEVCGSAVSLYTINYLLTQYGKDEFVTHLLDTRTFYIIPRISVDGSEVYLKTPQTIRSSTKIRPFYEEEDGIIPEDLTGNGSITTMRVKDTLGEWKKSIQDPRVMVRRGPADISGDFYRIYPEGKIKDFDGTLPLKVAKSKYYLDINRNFPSDWTPTEVSGDFPLSEPETRALAEFIVGRKNITGIISYHTFSGIILRPSAMKRDDQLNQDDLHIMKALAKRGEELTGYPSEPVFEGFNYGNPPKPLAGSFLDWNYEHLGLYSFTTELWDVAKKVGIEKKEREYARYWLGAPEDDQLKLLKWNDDELKGQGFKDWVTYKHPQLGDVEIGGWDIKYTLQNPPLHLLEEELHGNMLFSLEHAAASPKLEVSKHQVEKLADGLYKITLVICNTGYLPTYLSEKAKEKGQVREVEVEILGEQWEVVQGKAKQGIGHLDGYGKQPNIKFFGIPPVESAKTITWVVRQKGKADQLAIKVSSTKAGTINHMVPLS